MAHHSSNVADQRLEDFVVELANANIKGRVTAEHARDYGHMRRILNKFREFFPLSFPADSSIARERDELHAVIAAAAIQEARSAEEREQDSLDAFIRWSNLLRSAWGQADLRRKEWLLFELRGNFHRTVNPGSTEPPERTPFEQAVTHLQKIAREGRAKYCDNEQCSTPYFIAANSRYRFCSADCAAPSQREYKLNWWNKRGKQMRAKESKRVKKR
jgi:hypothetical protein